MDRSNQGPADRSKPGSDFLQLSIGDAPAGGRADWLARQLRLAVSDGRLPVCEAWMAANGKDAEQMAITTQRFFQGHPGPAITWKVYIVPPAK